MNRFELLQEGRLSPVPEVKHPEKLGHSALRAYYELGLRFCETESYDAVAINQFSPEDLSRHTPGPDPIRAVFFSPNESASKNMHADGKGEGLLVINPRVRTKSNFAYIPEYCGSIMSGRAWYMILRPKKFIFSGHIYIPGVQFEYKEHLCESPVSSMPVHERDHLDGLTAISRTIAVGLMDLRDAEDWRHLCRQRGITPERFAGIVKNENQPMHSFNKKTGRLELIDPNELQIQEI